MSMTLDQLQFKTIGCSHNGCQGCQIDKPYINLYVQITASCNASCEFCIAENNERLRFDMSEFIRIVEKILENGIDIKKVSFTGGEPTLLIDEVHTVALWIRRNMPKTTIVLNTNGSKLDKIDPWLFDSVALSRHHYDETINQALFDIKVPTAAEIRELSWRKKIHLSCLLMRDYISTEEQVTRYLDQAISIGVGDVGFVTLLPNNDFSRSQRITFAETGIEENLDYYKVHTWQDEDYCQCANYIKFGNKTDFIHFYAREPQRIGNSNQSNLTFDGKHLRLGFNGLKINV